MPVVTIPVDQWAEEEFGAAELGDRRRTRRLVEIAKNMASNPSGSLPQQHATWSDLKAAYNLLDTEEATFEALASGHWQNTRQRVSDTPRVLVIGDTTELDFGIHRKISGLGPTGNGGGRGFLMHSAVPVHPDTDKVFGVLGQYIHYRSAAPKDESTAQRLKRQRESEIWGKVIDIVGPPPENVQFIHVLDRGADNFEVRCHALEHGTDYVIRIAQLARKVIDPSGQETALKALLSTLPIAGIYEVDVPSGPGRKARKAKLAVSFCAAQVKASAQKSPFVRQQGRKAIDVSYVWVREIDPPSGEVTLEWVLETTLVVKTFEGALEVAGFYEKRWLIEEWHKAIKTGCGLEENQLKTAHRLEALAAIVSVVAIRLIQLRAESRVNPERPADESIPELYITCLSRVRRLGPGRVTVRSFWRGLAKLGGFIGRKGDGEPGWITIWRGWEQLILIVRGAEIMMERQPK